MSLQNLATDLGDLICVSVMAAVVGFWCWREMDRLAAVAFGLTYVIAVGVTTGLKMISARLDNAGPWDTPLFQFSSGAPSGHVALSVVVYGAAAYLCGRAKGWEGQLGRVALLLVIIGVAVTRVTLHTHTIADVLAGAVVGGVIVATPMALIWSRSRAVGGSARWLIAGMALAGVFMLASGVRLSSNDFNFASLNWTDQARAHRTWASFARRQGLAVEGDRDHKSIQAPNDIRRQVSARNAGTRIA
jgi:membrane-associated phospholipid phosphatase